MPVWHLCKGLHCKGQWECQRSEVGSAAYFDINMGLISFGCWSSSQSFSYLEIGSTRPSKRHLPQEPQRLSSVKCLLLTDHVSYWDLRQRGLIREVSVLPTLPFSRTLLSAALLPNLAFPRGSQAIQSNLSSPLLSEAWKIQPFGSFRFSRCRPTRCTMLTDGTFLPSAPVFDIVQM
jgi:hypothetical protein